MSISRSERSNMGLCDLFAMISQKRCMLWPKFIWNTYSKSYKILEFASWYLPRPRRGLRGIVFTRSESLSVCLSDCVSVCLSVCPANILVFYISAIRRDIDLKLIQDTYRVVLNSLNTNLTFIGQRSRSHVPYIAFWRYSHITKTKP